MFKFLKSWNLLPGNVVEDLQTYFQTCKTQSLGAVGDYVVFKEELARLVHCPAKYGVIRQIREPEINWKNVKLGECLNWDIVAVFLDITEGVSLIKVDSRMYEKVNYSTPCYSSIRRVMEKFNNDKPITPDVAPGTIVRFRKGLVNHTPMETLPETHTPLIVLSSDKDSVQVIGYLEPHTNHMTVKTRSCYELLI